MSFRQELNKINFIRFLSSIKLTVVCLILLYILTFVGTVAQVQYGLYQAQSRFFESFLFLAFGFLPFPGGQLVMWILFINLMTVALTTIDYTWRNIGSIITHFGLLLFLVSGYMTMHDAHESFLNLREGQASNVSSAYHDWEIAVWETATYKDPLNTSRKVTSIDTRHLKPGQTIEINDLNLQLTVKEYYKNCEAYSKPVKNNILNASGITEIEKADLLKEPEKNTPGGIFQVAAKDGKAFDVLLFGGENEPLTLAAGNKTYHLNLRLKHYPLPVTLKLVDFKKEEYPGTDMARKYQSLVEINVDKIKREKLISMNDPLRYKNYTFYQSSFSVDKFGNESSVLAVVKNSGWLMPYISTFVTFLGLVTHFIMVALRSRKKVY